MLQGSGICDHLSQRHSLTPKDTAAYIYQKTQHFAILYFVLCHLNRIKLLYLLSGVRDAVNTNDGSRAV